MWITVLNESLKTWIFEKKKYKIMTEILEK
jgi:hypothetical protein